MKKKTQAQIVKQVLKLWRKKLKLKLWNNSTTQISETTQLQKIVKKKPQKLRLSQYFITQIVTKHEDLSCDKTQKLLLWKRKQKH